jgi:hypothetical protein
MRHRGPRRGGAISLTPLSSQEGISGKKRGRKRRASKLPIFLAELGVHAPGSKRSHIQREPPHDPGISINLFLYIKSFSCIE